MATATAVRTDETPVHKQEIEDPLEVLPPRRILSRVPRTTGTTEIRQGSDVMAVIEQPGRFSSEKPHLRIAARRFRFDRPEDAGLREGLGNLLRGFFGMPRRRAIWRAGAGIATEIQETSQSRDRLSGRFRLEDQPYQVVCTAHGAPGREFDRRLHGPRGVQAILEPGEFDSNCYFLTPCCATRLDALVVGVHMMFWLEESAGGGAGGAGGAGPGGGGGGGC